MQDSKQTSYAKALASVLIPIYNSPDFILTLKSVLSQDYPNIEIIMVDDASDNFSAEEVESYISKTAGAENLSYIIHRNDKNLGVVKTMNKAFSLSNGEYLFSLAGDDCFYDSRVISDWVEEFQRSNALIITAKRQNYDEKLTNVGTVQPTKLQAYFIRKKKPRELFEILAVENFILGSCTARSREAFTKYGALDEKYRTIDDYPLWLRVLRSGDKIHFFDRIVIKYRGGGVSSTSNFNLEYEKENTLIFEKEVLPYTRHKFKMQLKHYAWKRRKKMMSLYSDLVSKCKNNKIAIFFLTIWVRAMMPLYTIRRIIEKYLIERMLK